MVEIEQEELERLKGIETAYGDLKAKHDELTGKHDKLKDDYIAVCNSRQQPQNRSNTDEFTQFCVSKFGK